MIMIIIIIVFIIMIMIIIIKLLAHHVPFVVVLLQFMSNSTHCRSYIHYT